MAFKPIQPTDIVKALFALDPHFRKRENVLKCITVGLTDCYSRIAMQSAEVSLSNHDIQSEDTSYTDLEKIGKGTFSEVMRACDSSGQVYALKRVGCKFLLLALREIIFLRFLQRKTCRGCEFFLNLVDAYAAGDCLCLVLGLCQFTLLDFVTDLRASAFDQVVEQEQQDEQQDELGSFLVFADDVIRPRPRLGDGREAPPPAPPLLPPEPQRRVLSPCFVRRLRHIATSAVSALSILRTEGIIHSDIKPENIFLQVSDDAPTADDRAAAGDTSASRGVDGLLPCSADLLTSLPNDDFVVRVGDFGNAFHKTEASKFYDDFSIQSLPYRSPEVLMGVPFGDKIDMWSLGLVLLELCTGCTLFVARTREDLFKAMCDTFCTPPSALLFAGGRFASELLSIRSTDEGATVSSGKPLPFADHVARIYDIIAAHGVEVGALPGSLFHFLAALTHVDPDQRLNATEALQHDFITSKLCIPTNSAVGARVKQQDRMLKSLSLLRSPSGPSSSSSTTSRGGSGVPTAASTSTSASTSISASTSASTSTSTSTSRARTSVEHKWVAGSEGGTLGKRAAGGHAMVMDYARAEHKSEHAGPIRD